LCQNVDDGALWKQNASGLKEDCQCIFDCISLLEMIWNKAFPVKGRQMPFCLFKMPTLVGVSLIGSILFKRGSIVFLPIYRVGSSTSKVTNFE
jgi:hypothetical protein